MKKLPKQETYFITPKDRERKEAVEKHVSIVYGVSQEEINKDVRHMRSSRSRFACWYILRTVYKMPYPLIAALYGKNYESVRSGIERAVALGIDKEVGTTLGNDEGETVEKSMTSKKRVSGKAQKSAGSPQRN